MGTKNLQLFTLIVLCLSISLTLLFSVFSVLNIIIVKAIPPFIVLLLITVLCALLSLHCYRCKKFNEVKKHKLFKVNIALCCLFGICAFAMLSILFYTVIYLQVFFDFQIYFLVVLIICVIYLISFIFINQEIIKIDKMRKKSNYPAN